MSRTLLALVLALAPALVAAQTAGPMEQAQASTSAQAAPSTVAAPATTTPQAEVIGPPETSAVIVMPVEATTKAAVDPPVAAPVGANANSTTSAEPTDAASAADNTDDIESAANADAVSENNPGTNDGRMRGADVFQRLAARLSQPTCPDAEAGLRWRKRYASHPASFAGHLAEILPLLEFVTGEIERSSLPAEFAFIPLVESWYRPDAMGIGGPAGMWQMIASTARNHGIHIQPGYDGRLSPVESTRAALSYLKVLYGMFGGDWQAAVMAYNAGENRLLKALKIQGNRNVSALQRKPHGLSAITYDYVSKLQALSCLITEPGRSGLTLPSETTFMPLAPVLVAAGTRSLEELARQQGIDAALLRKLNPGYRSGKIPAGVPRMVLVPGDPPNVSIVAGTPVATAAMAQADVDVEIDSVANEGDGNSNTNGRHRVQDGETLWQIAKRYGLSLEQLRKINHLGRSSLIRVGQNLRVQP